MLSKSHIGPIRRPCGESLYKRLCTEIPFIPLDTLALCRHNDHIERNRVNI